MSHIDRSFQRLESLRLFHIEAKDLVNYLETFQSLPRLFSLCFLVGDCFSLDLGRIYELVFRLPVLKRVTISAMVELPTISLQLNTTHQYSTIERMFIAHTCRLDELITLLSYTPQLCELICQNTLKSDESMPLNILSTLSALRSLTFQNCDMKFDECEPFLRMICSPLRNLRVSTNDDPAYLDANRWERLISHQMVNLREIHYTHCKTFLDHQQIPEHHASINRFVSLFRRQQRWTIKLSSIIDSGGNQNIVYSISRRK